MQGAKLPFQNKFVFQTALTNIGLEEQKPDKLTTEPPARHPSNPTGLSSTVNESCTSEEEIKHILWVGLKHSWVAKRWLLALSSSCLL